MFLPATFAAALIFTTLSTICWGSWANTFKATRNYRFELFYFDYGFGIFLISVVLAFTFGSHGGGLTAFLANLHQATASSLLYAALGGFGFNIANASQTFEIVILNVLKDLLSSAAALIPDGPMHQR